MSNAISLGDVSECPFVSLNTSFLTPNCIIIRAGKLDNRECSKGQHGVMVQKKLIV